MPPPPAPESTDGNTIMPPSPAPESTDGNIKYILLYTHITTSTCYLQLIQCPGPGLQVLQNINH